jgi:hypothetical protein
MLFAGCASHLEQFYPDDFFEQDNVYENKPLGFSLTYKGNWLIVTDPDEMTGASKQFAKDLRRLGAELLFVGFTVEGTQGTRGIAANLNEPPMEYAEQIRNLNKTEITGDSDLSEYIAGDREMVKWEYRIGDFHFVEFFFVSETYDVRVAFWTRTNLFDNFFPVYEEIISSIVTVGKF